MKLKNQLNCLLSAGTKIWNRILQSKIYEVMKQSKHWSIISQSKKIKLGIAAGVLVFVIFCLPFCSSEMPIPEGMVKIPGENFAIGKYEVTQREYREIMGQNPSDFDASCLPSNFDPDCLPVENVSWYNAMTYCERLTSRERSRGFLPKGYKYTLPTFKQWEIACRAGTKTRFCSGDSEADLVKVARFSTNSTILLCPGPVGSKIPNDWGIYDMHGNVWEWCLDVPSQSEYVQAFREIKDKGFAKNAKKSADEAEAMSKDEWRKEYGSKRAVRGGCWFFTAVCCESSFVQCLDPDDCYNYVGFRVALVPDKD